MELYDVLVTLLLFTPVTEMWPGCFRFNSVRETVRLTAERIEALDSRESTWLLRPEAHGTITQKEQLLRYYNDICFIRRRITFYTEMPLSVEAHRFPPRSVACSNIAISEKFLEAIEDRATIEAYRREFLDAVRDETLERKKIWEAIRDARSDNYYITSRRESLDILRSKLGREKFYSATVPCPVPFHRLTPIPD